MGFGSSASRGSVVGASGEGEGAGASHGVDLSVGSGTMGLVRGDTTVSRCGTATRARVPSSSSSTRPRSGFGSSAHRDVLVRGVEQDTDSAATSVSLSVGLDTVSVGASAPRSVVVAKSRGAVGVRSEGGGRKGIVLVESVAKVRVW